MKGIVIEHEGDGAYLYTMQGEFRFIQGIDAPCGTEVDLPPQLYLVPSKKVLSIAACFLLMFAGGWARTWFSRNSGYIQIIDEATPLAALPANREPVFIFAVAITVAVIVFFILWTRKRKK